MIAIVITLTGISLPEKGRGETTDFVVYSINQGLDLGIPNETPLKDYYLNLGASQGVKVGALLQIVRRVSTYDLVNEQVYRDMAFPIALVKVIHVEGNSSIARMEKWLPRETTPGISPKAVMLGDLVRFPQGE